MAQLVSSEHYGKIPNRKDNIVALSPMEIMATKGKMKLIPLPRWEQEMDIKVNLKAHMKHYQMK